MAQLAIKGHARRGKKVIEILEMLGGKNNQGYSGKYNSLWYYIDVRSEICVFKHSFDGCIFFTLEEFLEKFPYKVGDKVRDERLNDSVGEIIIAQWDDNENQIIYLVEWDDVTKSTLPYFARDLQPYKEETKDEKIDLLQQLKEYFDNTPREVIEKEWHDYDKYNEIAPTVNEYLEYVNKIRQPQYPKTYEECCEVLGIRSDWHLTLELDTPATHDLSVTKEFDYVVNLESLRKLIICCDAYWKIAGEWKPDWTDSNFKYCLKKMGDNIEKSSEMTISCILAFPTKEMRDAFKENFDGDIDVCKEFL